MTVNDFNLCNKSASITITQPITYASTKIVDSVTCNGTATGKAKITVTGNTTPYTYLWNDGTTKDSIINKSIGTYSLITTDIKGCKKFDTITLYQPSAVVASIVTKTNVTCFGLSTGSATATAVGGSPSYTYLWDNAVNAATTNTLNANNHKVIVTDKKGCKDSTFALINQPPVLNVTLNDTNATKCYGSKDGKAIVNVNGGNYPYNYNWAPAALDNDSIVDTLAMGIYKVIVTDSKLCKDTLLGIVIKQPDTMTLSFAMTPVTCNGFSNGKAKVMAVGGTGGTYTYLWSPGGGTNDSIVGKIAGTYSVNVKDINLCQKNNSVIITQPTALNTISSYGDSVKCFNDINGKAGVHIRGGSLPYSFAWSTLPLQTDSNAINLSAGTYYVTTTDAKTCVKIDTLQILAPATLDASAVIDSVVSCHGGSDGKVKVNAIGGNGTFTYNIGTGNVTNSLFIGLIATNYTITVTDQKGCKSQASDCGYPAHSV